MEEKKKRDWGTIVIGILLVLCGMFFIIRPGMTLITVTIFMGAALLVTGIYNIISYIRFRNNTDASGWIIAYGIIDIIVGLMFLIQPLAMAAVIPWFVAIFFAIFGVFEIVGAFRLKKAGLRAWGWMIFSGIMSILCAIVLFVYPPSISILIGIFVIMRGFSMAIYGNTVDDIMN